MKEVEEIFSVFLDHIIFAIEQNEGGVVIGLVHKYWKITPVRGRLTGIHAHPSINQAPVKKIFTKKGKNPSDIQLYFKNVHGRVLVLEYVFQGDPAWEITEDIYEISMEN